MGCDAAAAEQQKEIDLTCNETFVIGTIWIREVRMADIPVCTVCGKPVNPRNHIAVKNKITGQVQHMHPECAKA